jgi:L-seryl-tRNA(Ser) seleniumtransferase
MASKTVKTSEALRALPAIDTLLRTETGRSLADVIGLERLTNLARRVIDELRQEIIAGAGTDGREYSRDSLLAKVERRLAAAHHTEAASGIRRVINATGVILHTNLGRAPLSDGARRAIEQAAGYCNLEYDLTTGTRGRRGARAESLIAELCGAEAALIVNNCAAAALLVLSAFAREGETIVSRGELVEIGGDFRVPDVMAQSGTRMVEVGTTNRTRLADYAKAISDQTRLLMRVHTSNYRIVGFTKTPITSELAELAHERDLLLYEDAGSGALIDLTKLGVEGEPVIRDVIKDGADVVSFSGDKLLGGPQAGFLVGCSTVIEQMRKHPLYRALRADKLRLAAIEATLASYARGVVNEVPVQQALAVSADELRIRVESFVERVRTQAPDRSTKLELIEGSSAVGGGAAPTSELATTLISVIHEEKSANEIETELRQSTPPIISRIENDRVLLDLRTVTQFEEAELASALISLFAH